MIISVGQGNVWHFDPNSLTPTSTFTTATGAIDLAAGEGAVWSANSMGSVWRIEPSSGRVTKIALGHHPTGIASGDGAVWVAIS
jgi:streptogramin lyase